MDVTNPGAAAVSVTVPEAIRPCTYIFGIAEPPVKETCIDPRDFGSVESRTRVGSELVNVTVVDEGGPP